MSADPFIGEIFMFAGNFAIRSFALCDGQLLSINSNQALFSILGTTYGGDGRTTFGLPDMRGRVPNHAGTGPGLTTRQLGSKGGTETVTLIANQMPSHTHQLRANAAAGDTAVPSDAVLAASGAGAYETTAADDANMSSTALQNTGGSQSHNILQPYLAVHFLIALQGIFPSRN